MSVFILIDPISTVIRLGLNRYKDIGTKVSILSNKVILQTPSIIQGASRYLQGTSKNDISHFLYPIYYVCKIYKKNNDLHSQIKYLLLNLKFGLVNLIETYKSHQVITHCIKYYIQLIDLTLTDEVLVLNDEDKLKDMLGYNEIFEKCEHLWTHSKLSIIHHILLEIEAAFNLGDQFTIDSFSLAIEHLIAPIDSQFKNLIV